MLVWVFGGLLAAALPVAVGLMAILGSMAVLRFITFGTDVSNFALNLSTAMGLALAIDYTLLIISRYRDELAERRRPEHALIRTMTTAGRTVLVSATTVALSMAAMILFPMHVLKSFAYAGVATVVFAALAAVVVTPAAIVLLGDRLNAWTSDGWRGACCTGLNPSEVRSSGVLVPVDDGRHAPCPAARPGRRRAAGGARAPFLGVKWGFPDDRVLPTSASAHQVGDQLRNDFANNSATAVTVVIPDADGLGPVDLERYAAELSRVPDVSAVSAPTGTFVAGIRVGPPSAATGVSQGSAFLTVDSTAPLFSDILGDPARPAARGARTGRPPGRADRHRADQPRQRRRHHVTAAAVLGLIAVITFGLLFLLTGSVVLPLKALVLNVLSLTAAFGALVWIFQDGHLGALGTTSTGTLVANMPVLLFCIAFGLSMDYEVFLLSRIREYWLAIGADPCRQRQERRTGVGPHRPGDHRRGAGDVDIVRGPVRRARAVHADARARPDAGRPGRRHAGADGVAARLHARAG